MDSNEFVQAIKVTVEKSAIEGDREMLIAPPGMKPNVETLNRSNWYNSLSEKDKKMVMDIVDYSVKSGLFGFFCVLDGVRSIEGFGDKGSLKLYYEKDGERTLLNDPEGDFLHDLYNIQD